jgi:hypothetical protein
MTTESSHSPMKLAGVACLVGTALGVAGGIAVRRRSARLDVRGSDPSGGSDQVPNLLP